MSRFWRRLWCGLGTHEVAEPWTAPEATWRRTRCLGVQDGFRYTVREYRCRWCDAWYGDTSTVYLAPANLAVHPERNTTHA